MIAAFDQSDEKRPLRQVANAIIEAYGDLALDELAASSAMERCPLPIAEGLRRRSERSIRSHHERARDARAALAGFMRAGEHERAREVLDRLEELARRDVDADDFLALIDEGRHDPAWGLDDAAIARVRIHEKRGKHRDALSVLRQLFFRKAGPTPKGLHDAEGILKRIKEYPIDAADFEQLSIKHNKDYETLHASGDVRQDEATPPARSARVLIVGRIRNEARVLEQIRESHPMIKARIVQARWSSNWAQDLERFKRAAPDNDALVTLRFMRTTFGWHVRRNWPGDKPRRFCWNDGPTAIAEAAGRAAAAVG